jgi:hypothetical protein
MLPVTRRNLNRSFVSSAVHIITDAGLDVGWLDLDYRDNKIYLLMIELLPAAGLSRARRHS